MGHGVIDLRTRRHPRKPAAGLRPLFSTRPPEKPEKKAKRPAPLKARRRRKRIILGAVILVLVSAFAWGIGYLSYLPEYSIQRITIEGAQTVPPMAIQEYANTIVHDGRYHFLSRANIFLYPRSEIERDIAQQFPAIESAHITRTALLSTELVIAVQERSLFALWCDTQTLDQFASSTSPAAGTCYKMDSKGYIFDTALGVASSTAYRFYGGVATSSDAASPVGSYFAVEHLQMLSDLLRALAQAGYSPLGATVENDTDFSVPLQEGFLVKASFDEDPLQVVKNLQLVLSSDALQGKTADLEYVDLRFGDRVYYKFVGGATSSAQQ